MRPRQSLRRPSSPAAPGPELELGRKHRPDYWLLIICAILLAVGVIVVYAISPALSATSHVSGNYYTSKQLIAIGLSIVAFLVTAYVPLGQWQRFYKPLLVVAAAATLLALVIPVNPSYPAHRWVRLGSFSFQSVELVKFAVLVWLAGFLAKRVRQGTITDMRQTLKPLVIALLVLGVIIAGIQSDLGSMGVLVAIMGAMAFVAGLPLKRVAIIGGIIVIGLVISISAIPYRRARLEAYLHPQSNCQGSGYQACQALIAVGSGGMFGLGLGRSVQAFGYEPEAANDSIFAIFAEMFGFVGCVALLGLFIALFAHLKRIAERTSNDFARLIIIGILAWLSVQALINVGAMIGLLPLKGITLPFISYGGTSIVFVAAAMGLAFQISHYTAYAAPRISGAGAEAKGGSRYDDRRDGRRLGGAYHPDPSSRF